MGYVAGLAQRLCDSEDQPAKAEAVAIRALASFFPVTLHVARLHGHLLELMNQLDPRFLVGVRAGDEDAVKVDQDISPRLGLATLLVAAKPDAP
jgi:hypothetical protein